VQVSVTTSANVGLPPPAASNIIGWSENGDNLENYPLSELATSLAFATYRYDTFNGDGTTTQFTLSADPVTLGNLDVAVGGVTQTPGADYLLVGGVIEFTSAPPLGATILARFGEGVASGPASDSYDVRFRQAGTGSVDRTAEAKMRETVSVKDFGAVGDGVTDDTAAIQAAINYASNNRFPTVYAPAGKYKISTIYLTYDASLNPGFNSSALGRIRLIGAGRMTNNDIANYAGGNVNTGTIFDSTATSLAAIVLSTAAQEAGNYSVRQQELRDLSVVANTTGYVIQNYAAPQLSVISSVAVAQLGTVGGGILWRSSWVSKFERVSLSQPNGVVTAGSGLVLGANIFAGLYSFEDCSFNGYTNTVVLGGSQTSTNFAFRTCGFENAAECGILINGSQRNVAFDNCSFEYNKLSHLKISLSSGSSVRNLSVRDCFFYGATSAPDAPSEPMINLNQAQSADIANCHFYRPWTTLVYNAYDASATAGQRTVVRNCTVDTSGVTYSGSPTIYLVNTNNVQGQPLLIENFFPEGAIAGATFTLLNATYQEPTSIDNLRLRTVNYNLAGLFRRNMDVAFEQDTISLFSPACRVYLCTASDTSVVLPSSGTSGYQYWIANAAASTQNLQVTQVGGATLKNLTPGQALLLVGDPATNKFVGFETTFIQ
jgi:hypothetical protein